jgi:peptide/nickel transport system substrate-binding protein/oligopeptide transport system substrate-binding protein
MNLESNPNHFYGPPEEQKIQIKILPEIFSNIAEFETGRLDIMEVPQSEFSRWIDGADSRRDIFRKPELNLYYIGMNCSRPPFDDHRVRQAMNYAVDMKSVIKNLLNNAAIMSNGPIPPGIAAYDSSRDAYGYNPDKARELLQKAGYEEGFEVEFWQSQTSEYSELAEAFQAYFEDIEVRVNITRTDFNLLQDAIRQGEPEMYYLNWWADYPDAENFLYPLFHSSQAARRNRYSNPRVDSLIIANQTAIDKRRRIELARMAETEIHFDAPYVFLFHEITYEIAQPWVENYQPVVMFNGQRYRYVTIENPIE